MTPCTVEPESKHMLIRSELHKDVFPIAQHCRDCTQTREHCFLHGVHYPSCSNEPSHDVRMRIYP
jgi:hypothetical protein